MSRIMKILLLGFSLSLILLSQGALAMKVEIEFHDFKNKKGNILFAVFGDKNEFPKGKPVTTGKAYSPGGIDRVSTVIDLPPGNYAISAFLDANDNGKLDTNIVGIPKERFGFSKNPTIVAGAPSFNKCEFEVKESQKIKIKLITLLDQ